MSSNCLMGILKSNINKEYLDSAGRDGMSHGGISSGPTLSK